MLKGKKYLKRIIEMASYMVPIVAGGIMGEKKKKVLISMENE